MAFSMASALRLSSRSIMGRQLFSASTMVTRTPSLAYRNASSTPMTPPPTMPKEEKGSAPASPKASSLV